MEWRFEVGVASKNGILAALLAKEGAISASTAIEGEAGFLNAFANSTEMSELIAKDLGKVWSIMETGFKPYPVCAFNQTPVRTMLDLIDKNNFSYEDIEKIQVPVNPYEYNYAGMNSKGPFDSVGATLMSTPFCIALACVDRQVTLEGLTRFNDSKIKQLINRINHLPDEKIERYCAEITVHTKDGRKLKKESNEGPKYYNFDMDRTIELANRVTSETGVSQEKVARMIDMIKNMDKASDVKDLALLLGSCP